MYRDLLLIQCLATRVIGLAESVSHVEHDNMQGLGGGWREERLGDTNLTASNPQAEALVGLRSV